MTQQIEFLSQAITQLVPKPQQVQAVNQQAQGGVCELCGEAYSYTQCPYASCQKDEELNFVNNQSRGNLFFSPLNLMFSILEYKGGRILKDRIKQRGKIQRIHLTGRHLFH
jgi:ribosomal protein S18